jgi:hypothetical protein
MSNKLVEYIKLHLMSLKQDSEEITKAMNNYSDLDDAYRELEIEDISLNGQIIALSHILDYANELDGNYEGMVG